MFSNIIHRSYNYNAERWIEEISSMINDDHVSLWGLIIDAHAFGLEGEWKIEFIRRCMRSLLNAGAVAVDLTGETYPLFKATTRWGTEREEIIEAIIADWQARGGGDLDWGDYPFTWPENIGTV